MCQMHILLTIICPIVYNIIERQWPDTVYNYTRNVIKLIEPLPSNRSLILIRSQSCHLTQISNSVI